MLSAVTSVASTSSSINQTFKFIPATTEFGSARCTEVNKIRVKHTHCESAAWKKKLIFLGAFYIDALTIAFLASIKIWAVALVRDFALVRVTWPWFPGLAFTSIYFLIAALWLVYSYVFCMISLGTVTAFRKTWSSTTFELSSRLQWWRWWHHFEIQQTTNFLRMTLYSVNATHGHCFSVTPSYDVLIDQ